MPVDDLVPPLGATTDTLLLVEWYRQEGEAVTKDRPLIAVETDDLMQILPAAVPGAAVGGVVRSFPWLREENSSSI